MVAQCVWARERSGVARVTVRWEQRWCGTLRQLGFDGMRSSKREGEKEEEGYDMVYEGPHVIGLDSKSIALSIQRSDASGDLTGCPNSSI